MKTDFTQFKANVLSFVDSMHCENEPLTHYKLFARAEHTPFASAFAIFIRYMMGDLEKMKSSDRNEWIKYFQNLQDKESGLFCDSNANIRAVDKNHDKVHLDRQLTTFCISALECLKSSALYPLTFLDEFKDKNYLNNYLNNLNWTNSWNSGNKVMFIGISAIYNYEQFQDADSKLLLDNWFNWMDLNQNPSTGFWGTVKATHYFNGMGGFYHQFVVYNYMNKKVNYWKKIVDAHLFLQLKDGGYNPEMGGASCDDIDGNDPLVHFYHQHDYRRDEIKLSLKRSLDNILSNQNKDYGFCWSKHYWYDIRSYFGLAFDSLTKRDYYYSYLCARGILRGQKKDFIKQGVITGWSTNQRLERESSLFDTWFRCTSIAEISSVLTNEPISNVKMQFMTAPGLCWFNLDRSKFL